jgi:Tfp pilus assembly protein PilZ
MPVDVALDLLRKETGTHFDPEIVNVFLRYLGRINSQSTNGSEGKEKTTPLLREPRYAFQSNVKVNISDMTIDGVTVDISSGGVFLQFDNQLASRIDPNTIIQMEIDLPNAKGVHLEGQVRWVNRSDGRFSKRHPTGIGVAFIDTSQSNQRILKSTVHKLMRGKGTILYPQVVKAEKA